MRFKMRLKICFLIFSLHLVYGQLSDIINNFQQTVVGKPQIATPTGNSQTSGGTPQVSSGNLQTSGGTTQTGGHIPEPLSGVPIPNTQMGIGKPQTNVGNVQKPINYSPFGKTKNDSPFAFFKCRNNDARLCPKGEEIKYYLHNNFNTTYYEIFPGRLGKIPFRKDCPFLFITHGFLHDAFSPWVPQMISALFSRGCYNIIVIDWSSISRKTFNPQKVGELLTANVSYRTCCTGGFVGEMIIELLNLNIVNPASIHFVAHSLGAHLAGCASQYVLMNTRKKIGQITALDPYGGEFLTEGPDCKLTPDDSMFVDVIHTDSMLGHVDPIGHVDFYPNGGRGQPKCSWSLPTNTIDDKPIYWSHTFSIKLFIYSINNLGFLATDCFSYYTYECKRCIGNPTSEMGYHVDTRAKGNFYLDIHNCPPYVKYGEIVGKFKCLKQ